MLKHLNLTDDVRHHHRQDHGGDGRPASARIVDPSTCQGALNHIDHTLLSPGESIGEHQHTESNEEYYLILKGIGTMRLDGDRFPVRAGDLVRNRPGGTHALINDGPDTLEIFVFEVQVR